MDELLTLKQAALRLGLSPRTLRHQARHERIQARLIGKTWVTTLGEVERYRTSNLGRAGRIAAINPVLVRAYFIFGPVLDRGDAWLITYDNETLLVDPGGGNQVPFFWSGQPTITPIDSRATATPPSIGFDVLTQPQIEAILGVELDVAKSTFTAFPDPAAIFRAGPVWNAEGFERWHLVARPHEYDTAAGQ